MGARPIPSLFRENTSTVMSPLATLAETPSAQSEALRFPRKPSQEAFFPYAYRNMFLSRRLEERLFELFQKGYVKGTVTISIGNEATAVGMSLPLRPGRDVVSLLHRDFAAHVVWGATPYQLVCQYLANAESPTHGREGNVHHGDPHQRRFPMISHLGKMLSMVVGATWAARRNGEEVFGLAVIGDGGSSTGEFHESLNIASVRNVPVLFLVENNHYAFSTPTSMQYHCRQLSDRAAGYGISGRTIDGTDVWTVYRDGLRGPGRDAGRAAAGDPGVHERAAARPCGLRQGGLRRAEQMEEYRLRDPLPAARRALAQGLCPDRAADRPGRAANRGRSPRRPDAGDGRRTPRSAAGFPRLCQDRRTAPSSPTRPGR